MKIKPKINIFDQTINNLNNISRYDFEIDYDRTNCIGCEDYCRCTKIININIKSVDFERVRTRILGRKYDPKNIDTYCIDRIIRIARLFDPNNFEMHPKSGYYGQESGDMSINNINTVINYLNQIRNCKTINQKIEQILLIEYGHLLPELKDKNWSIKQINRNSIRIPQESYYRKIEQVYDKHFDLPIGIFLEDYREDDDDLSTESYRLIDGYHRTKQTTNPKPLAIVGCD